MSDSDVEIAAAVTVVLSCAQLLLEKKKHKRRTRRWWMVSLNKSRGRYSGSDMLVDLQKEPSGKFQNFCRISSEDFEILLNKIGPNIKKQDTNMRQAIPIKERLAITLRFLASGDSFVSLGYLFKISHQSISRIIPDVCQALIEALSDEIRLPQSEEEWERIANGFYQRWNFPHCLGAIDGKHVLLQAPFNSESTFYNYKKSFSIILLGLVDADYCFTFVDVGAQGRMNDAGVFAQTTLYNKMIRNELSVPSKQALPGRRKSVPYIFVGDDAFPLSTSILKPYSGNHAKGSIERIFNYRLCRARRIVENVFGILASVFRVFRTPMLLQPEKVSLVSMTCALLHNFLRRSKSSRQIYSPNGIFDYEVDGQFRPGTWLRNDSSSSLTPLSKVARKPSQQAKDVQREFAEYFITNGAVEWQDYVN